jgi:quercetin dioxygenase-like cupin family protein
LVPLQFKPGTRCSARYMESIMPPAVRAVSAHTHSGQEAFYIVSGGQCLQARDATAVSRAGNSVIVQAGSPMALNGVGTGNRAAVLLVLQPAQRRTSN